MTDTRFIDSAKIQFHPYRVVQTLDAQTDWEKAKNNYPIYAEISTSAKCNSNCHFCAVDFIDRKQQHADTSDLLRTLDEMAYCGVKSVMFAGDGESMLHPDINILVQHAYKVGLSIAFTTNGTRMDRRFVQECLQFCSWIKVSLNAGSAETYSKVHRVKESEYYKVLENIRYAVWYKKEHGLKCDIGVQSVLLHENAHEMSSLANWSLVNGVDYFVCKPLSQHPDSINKEAEKIDYSWYGDVKRDVEKFNTEDFSATFRSNVIEAEASYEKCYSVPHLWCYVTANLDVLACSAHYSNPRFNLGNLKDQSFQEIWQGEKRRKLFHEGIDVSHCRKACRMHQVNTYLDQVVCGKIHNVNFI